MKPMAVKVGDHVNIIQHPGGAQKQISFVANVVAFVGGGRVQYLTDTLPGSSGSPVFDTDWNLIALHHSGGWLTEPNAATKSTYYRNEGIAIDSIIQDLAAKPV
jgi:V8-like Glu-specific endopeptidase